MHELAREVHERGLFSCHPVAFTYFVPHFKKELGGFKLIEPGISRKCEYPKAISMHHPSHSNRPGNLRCCLCEERCIHVEVLERVLELANLKPCKPPIYPEQMFAHTAPLKLSNGLQGFWAILHRGSKRVLCKEAENGGDWACQQCWNKTKCEHVCRVTGETYKPPVIRKAVGWQSIPPKINQPPPKPDPVEV